MNVFRQLQTLETKAWGGKIWDQFKIDFWRAHQELVESTQTAQTAGFQGNNTEVQQNTIDAVSNIMNATIADRESMASLMQTIIHLTEEWTKTQEKLVAALTPLVDSNNIIKDGKPPSNRVSVSYKHYWYTHVPTSSHPSLECKSTKEVHKNESTNENCMGRRKTKWKLYNCNWVETADSRINNSSNSIKNSAPCSSTLAMADSGCTNNYICSSLPCTIIQPCINGIKVKQPEGAIIKSYHTALLDAPSLPLALRKLHIFPSIQKKHYYCSDNFVTMITRLFWKNNSNQHKVQQQR